MNREIHNTRDGIHVEFIPADHWWKRTKWRLLKEYRSHNDKVVVPANFITDGASVPFLLRWRFNPTGKYFGAAIVHDYLLIETQDWELANRQFNEEMIALGVSDFDRKLMVFGIGMWSKIRHWFGFDDFEVR